MHPYETASDSFIGDDQYHLRQDPSLFTLFFQNKRHKHKIFFPRILDAMSISVCTESHITNFYRIFFAIIIVNTCPFCQIVSLSLSMMLMISDLTSRF